MPSGNIHAWCVAFKKKSTEFASLYCIYKKSTLQISFKNNLSRSSASCSASCSPSAGTGCGCVRVACGSQPGTGLGPGGREEAWLGGPPGQHRAPLYLGRWPGGTNAGKDRQTLLGDDGGDSTGAFRQSESSEADTPPARVPTWSPEPLGQALFCGINGALGGSICEGSSQGAFPAPCLPSDWGNSPHPIPARILKSDIAPASPLSSARIP